MRPLLKPALRRVWRDATTLQIGLDPERAVVVAGLDPPAARLVDSLDGTRDLAGVLERARTGDLGEERARNLLELLTDAGVLDDGGADRRVVAALAQEDRDRLAPDLASLSLSGGCQFGDGGIGAFARRRRAAVLVAGAGRVGAAVASLLAAAGVGHVVPADRGATRPSDVGPGGLQLDAVGLPREQAARAAMRRSAQGARADLPRGRRPDVAVIAPVGQPEPELPDRLLRDGVAHLLVSVQETTGTVGPFVLPGRSACWRCLDLHRADRDPAWPRMAAQLATGGAGAGEQAACDVALATLVAAEAALHVLALLDGGALPPSVGGTVETRLPELRSRRRSWAPHPGCGCRWRGQ